MNQRFIAKGQGKVVAAFHVSPMVIGGEVHHWVVYHRWSFGVTYVDDKPVFKTLHLPDRETLSREFDWGGGSAQCLIKDGKPLELQPFPAPGAAPIKQPVPSTPQEAGHIPMFDHMRSCRASIGWSRDNRHLYLLFLKEPDSEAASIQALFSGVPLQGGWMVSDLQRFWLSKGVWGAINSDAGDVAQLTALRSDGKYDLVPPRWASTEMRKVVSANLEGAPRGGAMMYFYVRDAAAK